MATPKFFTTKVKDRTIKVPAFMEVEGTGSEVINLSGEDTFIVAARNLFKICATPADYAFIIANTTPKQLVEVIEKYLTFCSGLEEVEYIEDKKA